MERNDNLLAVWKRKHAALNIGVHGGYVSDDTTQSRYGDQSIAIGTRRHDNETNRKDKSHSIAAERAPDSF
jgi:hypothetical protein